jgi:prepilin-type N-terminal cleavage/methylation domain-containing protein
MTGLPQSPGDLPSMRTPRKSDGFTLIELMVVVVIIGILAALAIPRFSVASHKSKEKEADVMLKQVYTMQQTYYSQYGTYASTSAQLSTVGYEAPTTMQNYTIPSGGGYGLPLCLASKGAWNSRQIDATGSIDDC